MSDEFGCTGCFDPDCEWCLAEAVDLPAYPPCGRRRTVSERCSFGCRLIEGKASAEHEREEHTACDECGSEPLGRYPVAHKPQCSRVTLGPHLWPSPVSAPEGDR